jgi:uncharacterized Zn-finger protein
MNHKIDTQKCPHCDRELMNISKLKSHIKRHHEKTPCVHCGKLVAVEFMTAHILRQHTSNDDKKYKCDVCGKGFAAKQHFIDHKNIHSGEKPSSASFVQLVLLVLEIMQHTFEVTLVQTVEMLQRSWLLHNEIHFGI